VGAYAARRLAVAVPTVLGVFLAVFFMVRMIPGDPALVMLGARATEEQIQMFREQNGLNEPAPVQLAIALRKFVTGDLGTSVKTKRPVLDMIMERLPRTMELALLGILLGSLLGVGLGVVAAVFRNKWPDYLITGASTLWMSMPSFYIGLMLLLLLAVKLSLIPVIGTPREGVSHFKTLVAPLATMMIGNSVLTLRTTRASMLEIVGENFIKTARAKGLTERAVLLGHALRDAAIPIVTVIGYDLASSLGGAIIIETVFSRPGVGLLLIDSVNTRDYAVVQGTAVFIAIMLVLVNLLTDLAYCAADPRIRIGAKSGSRG